MKFLATCVITLSLFASNCFSQEQTDSRWSLGIGASHVDQSELLVASDLSNILDPYYYYNITGTFNSLGESSSDSTDTEGFYFSISYSFNSFDAGITYFDFGESKLNYQRNFYNSSYNYNGFGRGSASLDIYGIGLFIKKRFELFKNTYFSPTLGYLSWDGSADLSIMLDEGLNGSNTWKFDSLSDDGYDLYIGISLSHSITQLLDINVDWFHHSIDSDKVDSIGISITLDVK